MTSTPSSLWYQPQEIRVTAPMGQDYETVLTPEALRFVAELERHFGSRRRELLRLREERQIRLNNGELPDFLERTSGIRLSEWKVRPAPEDLQDRRVEITGPTVLLMHWRPKRRIQAPTYSQVVRVIPHRLSARTFLDASHVEVRLVRKGWASRRPFRPGRQ